MFGFLKKLFGCKAEEQTAVAPYKIETPVQTYESHKQKATQTTEQVEPVAVKLRQPGSPKQGAKKPTQGKKPQGQKKPAQPKQSGQKPKGRKPKAKPAAPQQ